MNRFVLPLMFTYFFPEYEKNLTVTGSEIIVFIFAGLLILLLSSFGSLFPTPVREAITELLQRTQHGLSYLSQSVEKEVPILGLSERKSMLLFCVLFAMALVVLLPYILGALCFASITIREFREIQKERDAEQNEFNRKRNLMLSDIAHDLRTPMTTVNGYAKALADGMVTDPQKQQEYLETIQKKSARMNDLINLLFAYVKLDSEGFSLKRKEVDLCELLRENAASDKNSAYIRKNHGEFISRFRHLIDAINKYLTENGIMTENRDDTISFDGYVRKLQKAANEYDFPAIEAIKKDMEELSMSDHQKEKYKMIRQMIEDTDIDDLQIISDIICGGKSEESIKE